MRVQGLGFGVKGLWSRVGIYGHIRGKIGVKQGHVWVLQDAGITLYGIQFGL